MPVLLLLAMAITCLSGCSNDPDTPNTSHATTRSTKGPQLARPGEIVTTRIPCRENGRIAVRVDVPREPRYGQGAPVVVVASTWFVAKYTEPQVGFHLVYNPVDVGAITVTHLWPGKHDPQTKIASDGVYDYGGPDSLAALKKVTVNDLSRQARHQELGVVTMNELLHEWAGHDLMHTVQAERALMQPFIQGCGPWQSYFGDHFVET